MPKKIFKTHWKSTTNKYNHISQILYYEKNMISLIVQSRGTISNIKHIISCYIKQNYKKKELILVIDQDFTQQSYNTRLNNILDWKLDFLKTNNICIFSSINSDFTKNNVSSMRNFWAQQAKGDYILFMDDDEDFHADFFTKNMEYWKKYRKIIEKDFVLTPTLMYRHTWEIQNQGFSSFNYFLSRPIGCILGQREWANIQMYSWNSLFAPAYIFQHNKMDERFDFVYEDLAYSYWLYKLWFPIVVTKQIKIYHMERDKTNLEHAWIGNIYQAYRKAKHRILFIRSFATIRQKIQFFFLWFRGQPIWLTLKVFLYKSESKREIIKNIWKGTVDWLRW